MPYLVQALIIYATALSACMFAISAKSTGVDSSQGVGGVGKPSKCQKMAFGYGKIHFFLAPLHDNMNVTAFVLRGYSDTLIDRIRAMFPN